MCGQKCCATAGAAQIGPFFEGAKNLASGFFAHSTEEAISFMLCICRHDTSWCYLPLWLQRLTWLNPGETYFRLKSKRAFDRPDAYLQRTADKNFVCLSKKSRTGRLELLVWNFHNQTVKFFGCFNLAG